jgi:hypothetical protein
MILGRGRPRHTITLLNQRATPVLFFRRDDDGGGDAVSGFE